MSAGTPTANSETPRALFERALAHQQAGRLAEAEAVYREVIARAPDAVPAHANLGATLHALGRYEEAVDACSRAIEQDAGLVAARNTRGSALRALGRPQQALADLDAVLALRPRHAIALNNRGNVLRELGRHSEALASYVRAEAAQPGYGRALHNEALCRLVLGDLERGFARYEARGLDDQLAGWPRQYPVPRWSLAVDSRGKTVLLHAEQGLGDAIQFSRYATLVAERGATVLLEAHAELAALLARIPGVARTFALGSRLPPFDLHCPLMSLPHAFGTRIDSIPANVPYLAADPARAREWAPRVGERTGPIVGLAWSGRPTHVNDRNRSIALSRFVEALAPGARYVSLQTEVREDDRDALAARPEIAHFGRSLRDFDDTAALVDAVDLVITVDTAAAHLAGAMGKPVWILLAFDPDWRWMLARDDSPWYPTARLFRQTAHGEWQDPIARCRESLRAWIACRGDAGR